jgi:hypothetical protein
LTERNEAAFARPIGAVENHFCRAHKGLTKRELFAAMAMQGLLATQNGPIFATETAICAVANADALIKELNCQIASQPTPAEIGCE